MKKMSVVLLALCFASCDMVQVDFFQLGEFRLMALVADNPEVEGSTAQNIEITPWISDIEAAGRLVQLEIVACPDPGIALGAEPTCDTSLLTTQTIDYNDFNTQALAASQYTGAMPSFSVTIPDGLLSNLSPQQQFNGVDYLISMVFRTEQEEVPAFKRIRVSTKTDLNNNPQIESILADGSEDEVLEDQDVLTYEITPGFGPETYELVDASGNTESFQEQYLLTWFVFGGTTSLSRSEIDQEAEFMLQEEFEDTPFVVGILRDDRGGLNVQVR